MIDKEEYFILPFVMTLVGEDQSRLTHTEHYSKGYLVSTVVISLINKDISGGRSE